MEINVHFILFEELQQKPDGNGAVSRIMVIREGQSLALALEEGSAGFHPSD